MWKRQAERESYIMVPEIDRVLDAVFEAARMAIMEQFGAFRDSLVQALDRVYEAEDRIAELNDTIAELNTTVAELTAEKRA